MTSLLGSLLVFSALTATGFSLTCYNCINVTGTTCNQPTVTCPAGDVCIASYSLVTVTGSAPTTQYSITCGSTAQCNVTGSWTVNFGTVRTGVTCCSTDNCTPTLPTLPTQGSQPNNVTCRTCSSYTDYCYTGDTIGCTGSETKCGILSKVLTGTISQATTIRGCTTPSFCDTLGTGVYYYSGLNIAMTTYCSNGAVGLYAGFFGSAFTFLLTILLF
ncbi:phospholipase A2 inhibitor NAI-like [Pseudophryne corroboree]|uniref:phospholipase A2 inhibitor NAI-like n=1 Tax=Pseudophryne corroboree TaxID=495146 RepID=UPI003081C905